MYFCIMLEGYFWVLLLDFTVDGAGNKEIDIPTSERISVSPGDYIGWQTISNGVITFDDGGSNDNLILLFMPSATYGALVDWSSAIDVDKRSYSIVAIGERNNPPGFRNLPALRFITKDRRLGDLLHIEVFDDDNPDIHVLKVTLEQPSLYFEVKPGTTLVTLVKEPPSQLHELKLRVTDPCGAFSTEVLNISVVDFGHVESPLAIKAYPEGFIWDWLVLSIIAVVIVLIAVTLIFVFHMKGWLDWTRLNRSSKIAVKDKGTREPVTKRKIDVTKNDNKNDDVFKPEERIIIGN